MAIIIYRSKGEEEKRHDNLAEQDYTSEPFLKLFAIDI